MKREAEEKYARKVPKTVYVLETLYMTSANEFITVYAGLMISQLGRSARPKIQDMMMTGRMKSVTAAMDSTAFLGYSEERAAEPAYDAKADNVPGALPAVLVTGKETGNTAKSATAMSGSTTAVTRDQATMDAAAFFPFISLPREATAEGKVNRITGIVMKMPRFIRNEETSASTPDAPGVSPKSSAVARPMRTAAM